MIVGSGFYWLNLRWKFGVTTDLRDGRELLVKIEEINDWRGVLLESVT